MIDVIKQELTVGSLWNVIPRQAAPGALQAPLHKHHLHKSPFRQNAWKKLRTSQNDTLETFSQGK